MLNSKFQFLKIFAPAIWTKNCSTDQKIVSKLLKWSSAPISVFIKAYSIRVDLLVDSPSSVLPPYTSSYPA